MLTRINYRKLRIMTNVFKLMVANQRMKASRDAELQIEQRIQSSATLCEKCILALEYINPQSTLMEKVIKADLEIITLPTKPVETAKRMEKHMRSSSQHMTRLPSSTLYRFAQIIMSTFTS